MAINLENVIEFDSSIYVLKIRMEEKRKFAFIYLFSSNKFYVCIVYLFVSFISAFILPFSCDVTDVCVSVDLVFCGVFCVVYRNYTLKILMLFLIASHLQPPRKYLTIKFYTQQFIIKSNHHHQQIHRLQYTSGDWADSQIL